MFRKMSERKMKRQFGAFYRKRKNDIYGKRKVTRFYVKMLKDG
jgi:hypothetical protein